MEPNLFTRIALDDLSMEIKTKEVIVVVRTVIIDGISYDANDLLEVLEQVSEGDQIAVTDVDMANMLLNYSVLSTTGSIRNCYSASPGPNFDKFCKMLNEKLKEE